MYSEMYDSEGNVRPPYQAINKWLKSTSESALLSLNQQALAMFYRKGVTFTVYSDANNTERVIPFDIIPRIIPNSDWQIIETGCTQRIRALNMFLDDLYHQRDILKAGVIPKDLVLTNECFQPWMMDIKLPRPIYAHISGIDIIRNDDGNYYVLEDNLRTPSGISYLIESRMNSEHLLGEIYSSENVLPINNYPDLLKLTLQESTNLEQPKIVVLTPGHFNSAYYEHAFLAREMGVALVSGRDLFVEDNQVFISTIEGRERVDVIYRRIDDPFIDPLAFRNDSILGVPGLMAAYRSGNVVIVNAPGTGVADDKSVYPYVGEMIRFYLNEEPILHNVKTYMCRKNDERKYVLDNLKDLVVKETQGSGGYGMLIGPMASKTEIEDFRAKIKADPTRFIAQPTLCLSTSPTCIEEGIVERHIDLRPFVLTSPDAVRIVPGGLTRVALREGSLVVNSSQGGGVKDTWVLGGEL